MPSTRREWNNFSRPLLRLHLKGLHLKGSSKRSLEKDSYRPSRPWSGPICCRGQRGTRSGSSASNKHSSTNLHHDDMPEGSQRSEWVITLAAAAILMVTMGTRQSLGLFISPLKTSTGLGITTISLAFAIAQLMWGVIQPVAGAVADRYGPAKILIAGLVVLAIGMTLTPFMTSGFGLIVSLGILSAVGSGAGQFSFLIRPPSRHLPADIPGAAARRHNATGALGQFAFAPVAQTLI